MTHIPEIVAILVALAIGIIGKIVFDWLKNRKGAGELMNYIRCPLDRSAAIANLNWLKEVHDKHDADGLPLWYIPRSMVESLSKTADATAKQNVILERIDSHLTSNGSKLDTIISNGRGK